MDKLADIFNEYNNPYHSTIEMKPADVNSIKYIDFEQKDKDPKSEVGSHVGLSQYKNIFAKGYTPDWSEEVLAIVKVENTIPWTNITKVINGEEIVQDRKINIVFQKTTRKINNRSTSNKTRLVEADKKLNYHITSYKKTNK